MVYIHIKDKYYSTSNYFIGAGLGVPTVRLLSERVAEQNGGTLIRINLRDTHIGSSSGSEWVRSTLYKPQGISLSMPGLEAIQKINSVLKE